MTFVVTITVLNILYWLFSSIDTQSRKDRLRELVIVGSSNTIKFNQKKEDRQFEDWVDEELCVDGCLLLRIIELHVNPVLTADLVHTLWLRAITPVEEGAQTEGQGGQAQGGRQSEADLQVPVCTSGSAYYCPV